MIRFVVDPGGAVVPDVEENLPGRGLWLRADSDTVRAACVAGAFSRAARATVIAPPNLADLTEALMRRRCLSILGLAKRARQFVGGFELVSSHLRSRRAAVLIAASDGGDDGRAKIRALAPMVPIVDLFDGVELGGAVGRERMVHALICPGKMASNFLRQAERISNMTHGETVHCLAG